MSRLTTSIVQAAHAYTRSHVPWKLDTSDQKKPSFKLFHYISGGGMKSFGRTIQQEEVSVRQTKFLIVSAVCGVLWVVFLVI